MRLAYDHQVFTLQPYGGISRYFVELASRVASDPEFDVEVVAPMHLNELLRHDKRVPVTGWYVPHLRGTFMARYASNWIASRAHFAVRSPKLIHETYFALERNAGPRVPTVVTVFDMIHERFRDSFSPRDSTRARKRAAVRRASRVICISESTRSDLLEEIDIDPARVFVTPLAVDPALATRANSTRLVQAPYVLYVGARGGYKNFAASVAAFAASGLPERGVVFVCFGGAPWNASDRDAVASAGLRSDMVLHLRGGDDALATLYKHAEVFLYPSLYEGFGIPPLEAMVCGCPVASSMTSSLPEVVGAAAETFDPGSVEEIAGALLNVVDSPGRAAELRTRGYARAGNFSWQRCADQTKEIYRSLV